MLSHSLSVPADGNTSPVNTMILPSSSTLDSALDRLGIHCGLQLFDPRAKIVQREVEHFALVIRHLENVPVFIGHHVHRTQRDQYHLPDNRSGIASRANVFAESARVCEAAGLLILLWPICLTGSGAPGCR